MECPHAVLGVSKGCSPSELKKAYKQKVKQTHPDATRNKTDVDFIKVKEAYAKILSLPREEKDTLDSLPYMTVRLSEAARTKCRCGTIYADADQLGTAECMTCSHYIEVVPDEM
ncbi:hypothetical protein NEMIN01_0201 [Nematocida minor]|uniref:uncharacterized protein n=1 Tax=Nematocida minor TaxID=1912983 RepID=UPI00221FFFE0|nr:uncharacterized protein NEMIN01_0097 [Nematocida minor]XP_051332103.1 uncharacterized protein NEMIN01_0201 [Nematocida minor]KAI5188833.1 hypothetical protein NEMIN01_0097 [Nematocida minor]KAI5188937.1 hypothetical protein NEMIN01_0201 [Nematocida minor]